MFRASIGSNCCIWAALAADTAGFHEASALLAPLAAPASAGKVAAAGGGPDAPCPACISRSEQYCLLIKSGQEILSVAALVVAGAVAPAGGRPDAGGPSKLPWTLAASQSQCSRFQAITNLWSVSMS